ncbi:MAG TPA: hypothetical protein VE992_05245 [Solirubrobacteraceae bacterium]|nr:hypothetical protein [Solirubrobacteraceae bacterium]
MRRRTSSPLAALALAVLCVAQAACAPLTVSSGGGAPAAASSTSAPGSASARSAVAIANATHQYPSGPVSETVTPGPGGPAAVVRAFAGAYINWSATTVSGDMRRLAAQSIGQARSAMQLAAAQTAGDYELRAGGVANHGTVEAVAPLPGQPRQYVVVTREQTTATGSSAYAGLAPAWHVALATVAEVAPGRWALSAWEPQS